MRRPRLGADAIRRLGTGALHIPGALLYLARRPGLWPRVLLPAVAAALLVIAGLLGGALIAPAVQDALAPGRRPMWVEAPAALGAWLVTPLAGALLGLAGALALTASLLDWLSREIERRERGRVGEISLGLRWDAAQSLHAFAYFALRAPVILAVGLIPLVGPLLAAAWAAHALTYSQTEGILARRGLGFRERRAWHRQHRAESLGFGLAGLWTLLVPVANLLLLPLLATGATRLVLAIETGGAPPGAIRSADPSAAGVPPRP